MNRNQIVTLKHVETIMTGNIDWFFGGPLIQWELLQHHTHQPMVYPAAEWNETQSFNCLEYSHLSKSLGFYVRNSNSESSLVFMDLKGMPS